MIIIWKLLNTTAAKYIAVAALAVASLAVVVREHDKRILAEATLKESVQREATLVQEKAAIAKAGAVRVAGLQDKQDAVKTPEQAVTALVSDDGAWQIKPGTFVARLNPIALPDSPGRVAVDAVPLAHEVNNCQQCAVALEAAKAELAKDAEIDANKDEQIDTLKHKGGNRFVRFMKQAACTGGGAAVGSIKGGKGAAIGAVGGLAVCSLF